MSLMTADHERPSLLEEIVAPYRHKVDVDEVESKRLKAETDQGNFDINRQPSVVRAFAEYLSEGYPVVVRRRDNDYLFGTQEHLVIRKLSIPILDKVLDVLFSATEEGVSAKKQQVIEAFNLRKTVTFRPAFPPRPVR